MCKCAIQYNNYYMYHTFQVFINFLKSHFQEKTIEKYFSVSISVKTNSPRSAFNNDKILLFITILNIIRNAPILCKNNCQNHV